MATTRPTQGKRIRENAQQEKKREKEAKRLIRKEQKRNSDQTGIDSGIDVDLIGIFPGPQPPQDQD